MKILLKQPSLESIDRQKGSASYSIGQVNPSE